MNRVTRVNIFGVGRVSRQAVAEAAQRHPDVRFRFFSRNPQRYPSWPLPNVRFLGLDHLKDDGTPLVLCMASDEGRIVREFHRRETGTVPRSTVAAANLRLLREAIDPALWRNRLVIVVTNPVELVCDSLVRATGNLHVYGFGMTSDRQRVADALRQGFRLRREEASAVSVTGLHCLRPIPLLSSKPDLLAKLGSMSAEELVKNLSVDVSNSAIAGHFSRGLNALPRKPCPYSLVSAMVNASTAAEFRGAAPPVGRGAANLARLLSGLANHRTLSLSGRSHGGHFLGGVLDLKSGQFRVPSLGADERKLLDHDLAEYDRLRRQHLE